MIIVVRDRDVTCSLKAQSGPNRFCHKPRSAVRPHFLRKTPIACEFIPTAFPQPGADRLTCARPTTYLRCSTWNISSSAFFLFHVEHLHRIASLNTVTQLRYSPFATGSPKIHGTHHRRSQSERWRR